jgi:large subunit ribosomal protein L3
VIFGVILMNGLLGKKLGMTQIFDEDGRFIPITVIEAGPCFILNISKEDSNGFRGVRLGFEDKKETKATKPELGLYKNIDVGPKRFVHQIKWHNADELKLGQKINVGLLFKENEYVDITGHSIGKGFQGVVKRHHFRGGPGGHGSMFHRAPGSIGSMAGGKGCRKNVRKGQRMAGRMGGERVTVQNLKIVKIDTENNLLLVKGPVPGYDGSYLVIRKAKKKYAKH